MTDDLSKIMEGVDTDELRRRNAVLDKARANVLEGFVHLSMMKGLDGAKGLPPPAAATYPHMALAEELGRAAGLLVAGILLGVIRREDVSKFVPSMAQETFRWIDSVIDSMKITMDAQNAMLDGMTAEQATKDAHATIDRIIKERGYST